MTGLIEELTGQPGIAHHIVEGLTKTLHPRNKSAKEKKPALRKKKPCIILREKLICRVMLFVVGASVGRATGREGKVLGKKAPRYN